MKVQLGKGSLASEGGAFILVHYMVLGFLRGSFWSWSFQKITGPDRTPKYMPAKSSQLWKQPPVQGGIGYFPQLCGGIPDTTTSGKKDLF